MLSGTETYRSERSEEKVKSGDEGEVLSEGKPLCSSPLGLRLPWILVSPGSRGEVVQEAAASPDDGRRRAGAVAQTNKNKQNVASSFGLNRSHQQL